MRLVDAAERSFAAHETFHPRYSWFRKACAMAAKDGKVFNRPDASVKMGVGKNMVRSIRFWGLAARLITKYPNNKRGKASEYAPTRRGVALFDENGWDPYMEDPGTLWLLHWLLLAPKKCRLPVWWLAFNEFNAVEFSHSELEAAVSTLLETAPDWSKPHPTSIKKDVSALLRTYAPAESTRRARIDDMLDCPLRELRLLDRSSTAGRFRFTLGPKATLPSEIVAYAVLDYIALAGIRGSTATFDRLASEPGSPGRVFKLTEAELIEAVKPVVDGEAALGLAAPTGAVQLTWSQDPAAIATRLLDEYYEPAQPLGPTVCAGPEGDLPFNGQQTVESGMPTASQTVDSGMPTASQAVDSGAHTASQAVESGMPTASQPTDTATTAGVRIAARLSKNTAEAARLATAAPSAHSGSASTQSCIGRSAVKLEDAISVRTRFARSVSLERDISRAEPLDGYVVTARALDVVERVADAAVTGSAGGAWSLTGPYGSGKSSLALLLDAVFGEFSDLRSTALLLVDEAAPDVGELIRESHLRHKTEACGFHRGLVTADREPLSHTILRALRSAVVRRYGRIPSTSRFRAAAALRGALQDAESDDPICTGPSPSALVDVACCLAEDAPLLLMLDEFGKNLEAIGDSGDTDPYLLQRLAESGQGSGLPIFLLTLQHLSFEDHLAGADRVQRREWAKVQGRFEDVAFVESARETRALIGTVFDVHDQSLRDRIGRWADTQAEKMRALGISDLADPGTLAACYPLHPLTALVLPELCNRHGQHERTLFSFLTGPHAANASAFLAETDLPLPGETGPPATGSFPVETGSPAQENLPTIGLDAVYDYFVGSSALHVGSSLMSGRWTEIATRLRDTHGLTPTQIRLAKSVALLNLISTSGTVRASRQILALVDGTTDQALTELEEMGVVTYRDFADEYRIWQGTDVDVRSLLETCRQRVEKRPLAQILTEVDSPRPMVAARHSAKHDVLRVFSRRYASPGEQAKPLDIFSRYDGEVLLVAGADAQTPVITQPWAALKPIVAAIPRDVAALDTAARETAAVRLALDDPSATDDWVAQRELGERLARCRVTLDQTLTAAFGSESCRWILLGGSGRQLPGGRRQRRTDSSGRQLCGGRGSSALSDAADLAYPDTPMVRNEMLNRTELTSQGAKARGMLLKAMIEQCAKPGLGMDGDGPEVAMYRAFLGRTGLHGPDKRNSVMIFRDPEDESLRPAWETLRKEFRRSTARRINLKDVHAMLASPPFGIKAGVVPVLVTAALLASSEEVAIYEHGTFKPVLTPALSERMVRNPAHFDIKHFANTTGARLQVVDAIAERLDLRPGFRKHRVANVLRIVGHLVTQINRLDNYTRRTRQALQPDTTKARDVLIKAVEPDELLFTSLPETLGLPAVPATPGDYLRASDYADGISDFLDELSECFSRLLDDLSGTLLRESAVSSRDAIMGLAIALKGEVLNPRVRAFVLALAKDSGEDDKDWAKAVATVVTKKAPAEWSDEDLQRFQRDLRQLFNIFHRLIALHAEHRAHGAGAFSAYQVTVTKPDGTEEARLVNVDESHKPQAERALDRTLEELTRLTGSPLQARNTLLALLGERVLVQAAESARTGEHEATRRKFSERNRSIAAVNSQTDEIGADASSPAIGNQTSPVVGKRENHG